jgi:hypothetical protein
MTDLPEETVVAAAESSVYSAQDATGNWRLYWTEYGSLVETCERCGCQWFDGWDIPGAQWEAGRNGHNALCRPCFDLLAAEATIAQLREALEAAMRELGIPSGDYPAPVANAWRILAHAARALAPQERTEP